MSLKKLELDIMLFIRIKNGLLSVVQYLIEKNVEISIKGFYNIIPHLIMYIKYLVYKGANKNAKDKWSKTPYDWAGNDDIRNIIK